MANSGARHQGQPVLHHHRRPTAPQLPPNYALFGQVTDGLDTDRGGDGRGRDAGDGVPTEPIEIQSIRIVET